MQGFVVFLLILNLVAMAVCYALLASKYSSRKILSEIRAEVDKLVTDLGREADRDVALLESRIKNLRSLIDEADRRVLLAKQEETKRAASSEILKAVGTRGDIAGASPSRGAQPAESRADVERPRRATGDAVQVYSRPQVRRAESQIVAEIPLRERVLDLALKGISPEMISHTLSMPLGEVELILDMNDSSL